MIITSFEWLKFWKDNGFWDDKFSSLDMNLVTENYSDFWF